MGGAEGGDVLLEEADHLGLVSEAVVLLLGLARREGGLGADDDDEGLDISRRQLS